MYFKRTFGDSMKPDEALAASFGHVQQGKHLIKGADATGSSQVSRCIVCGLATWLSSDAVVLAACTRLNCILKRWFGLRSQGLRGSSM